MTSDEAEWASLGWPSESLPTASGTSLQRDGSNVSKKVTQRPDGSSETVTITTFKDGQVIDDYVLSTSIVNGVKTFLCVFNRRHYITDKVGPSIYTKGRTKIVDDGNKIVWRLTFTDTTGLTTVQDGKTDLQPGGTSSQSVTTTYHDSSGKSEEFHWTVFTNATFHAETFKANGDTLTTSDGTVASSNGEGPWVASTAQSGTDDGSAQDASPPPYGPRGPVIGGDVIDRLQ